MDLGLSGRVAVVTGAGKGIGMAVTRALVEEGALVVAASRTTEALEGIDGVTPVAADLSLPEAPAAVVRRALDAHGRLDVLINNVGLARVRVGGFLGTSDEEFAASMNINFYAAVRATRAALAPMLEQGGGAIVNTASVNAFYEPDAGVIDYGAAKAALVNFSKSIAQEFGPRGIRINSVSPGPVATDLWLGKDGVAATVAQASGVSVDEARASIVAGMGGFPTGRFTTPEEVATLLVLLASDRTANVTGSEYVIDGGLIKTT